MDRIARYISAPLAPVEVRELPCHLEFHDAEPTEWEIGGMKVRADSVTHRGPTLGYRIESGRQIGLLHPRPRARPRGPDLRHRGRLDLGLRPGRGREPVAARLPVHRRRVQDHLGWGHSPLTDALEFGRRTRAPSEWCCSTTTPCTPTTSWTRSALRQREQFEELGGDPAQLEMATEQAEIESRSGPARRPPVERRHPATRFPRSRRPLGFRGGRCGRLGGPRRRRRLSSRARSFSISACAGRLSPCIVAVKRSMPWPRPHRPGRSRSGCPGPGPAGGRRSRSRSRPPRDPRGARSARRRPDARPSSIATRATWSWPSTSVR